MRRRRMKSFIKDFSIFLLFHVTMSCDFRTRGSKFPRSPSLFSTCALLSSTRSSNSSNNDDFDYYFQHQAKTTANAVVVVWREQSHKHPSHSSSIFTQHPKRVSEYETEASRARWKGKFPQLAGCSSNLVMEGAKYFSLFNAFSLCDAASYKRRARIGPALNVSSHKELKMHNFSFLRDTYSAKIVVFWWRGGLFIVDDNNKSINNNKEFGIANFHIHHDFMLSFLMHLHNDDVVECFTECPNLCIATIILSSAPRGNFMMCWNVLTHVNLARLFNVCLIVEGRLFMRKSNFDSQVLTNGNGNW